MEVKTVKAYEIGQRRLWERRGPSLVKSVKKTEKNGLRSEENCEKIVSWEKERTEF